MNISNQNIYEIPPGIKANWVVPEMSVNFWQGKTSDFCVVIPVINEGERIHALLRRMAKEKIANCADIIIVDGGSNDNSLEEKKLRVANVRGVIVKTGMGKLSAQLRCAYAFALEQGYKGIITIDGNNKDDPKDIPNFIRALESGADFVQASRFITGGIAENTPKSRNFAIRYIHAPCLSIASGFKWTDTTQGFRAYSRRILLDPKIAPFRAVFNQYELLAYLSCRVPKLGYSCVELPTVRKYPKGKIPTKISMMKGNWLVFTTLLNACMGRYNP